MDGDAAAPAPTTFGELEACVESVPRILQMPQAISRPGSSDFRQGSMNPQSDTRIFGLVPTAERNTSTMLTAKPDKVVSCYPCL